MDTNKSSKSDTERDGTRKKYQTPKVTAYGNIREITQALSGMISDMVGVAGLTNA